MTLSYNLILDSGAVALYSRYVKKNTRGATGKLFKDRRNEDYSFYTSIEFKRYRKAYIKYVLKNDRYLSGYVNLDVINNAEASYKSLKYMEKRGCHPLPVFHLGNDVKWLIRYVNEGYDYICMGGVPPNRFEVVEEPLDRIWKDILIDSNNMPKVKVHGLACTSFKLIKAYPWYSVDSTSWKKAAAYGKIFVPRPHKGEFCFDKPPFTIGVSSMSPTKEDRNMHILTLRGGEREWTDKWLDYIKIPLGSVDEKDVMIKWGVLSHHEARGIANMKYYCELAKSVPDWPWPFNKKVRKGFLI